MRRASETSYRETATQWAQKQNGRQMDGRLDDWTVLDPTHERIPVYTGSYSVPSLFQHVVLIPLASVHAGPRKRSTRTIRDVSEREMVGQVSGSVEFKLVSDDRTAPSRTTVGNPRDSPSLASMTTTRNATTHRSILAPVCPRTTPGTIAPFRSLVIPRDRMDDHRGTQRKQAPFVNLQLDTRIYMCLTCRPYEVWWCLTRFSRNSLATRG